MITAPFFDIVEDTNGALSAGTRHATARLANGSWVMQMAAFSITGVTFTGSSDLRGYTHSSGFRA